MRRYTNITSISPSISNYAQSGRPRIYRNTIYPTVPTSRNDTYVITDFGDRLDTLAQRFYKDSSLWWVISSANPNSLNFDSLAIAPGTQLRIPVNPTSVVTEFRRLNTGDSSIGSITSGGRGSAGGSSGGGGAGGGY